MTEKSIILTDEEAMKECELIAQDVQAFKIIDISGYTSAAEVLKKIKGRAKDMTTRRLKITRPLDESKRETMLLFKRPLTFLSESESLIKNAMLAWNKKQEEIRIAEEKRAAEAQEKAAAKLKKRSEKAAEKGQDDKAEQLQQEAEQVESFKPIVPANTTKVAGIQKKTIWKCRITDVGAIPREYMIPDEKMLGNIARSTKGSLKIPGVEFYSEETIASGRG